MAQEYLPAPSNVRLADLMKEHNISQPELAKEIGCSKSTISRFISGAKGTLTHEQVLKIARLFKVSTDFLLGETNIPDRKNYDIAELGLSVEAAKNLYTGRVNTEVVNLLLENARFAELTYRIAQYFDDTFASGIAAQNAMLTTLARWYFWMTRRRHCCLEMPATATIIWRFRSRDGKKNGSGKRRQVLNVCVP